MAKDDLVERVRQRTPACAKVGVFDVDGIFRGKYMAPDKLASALDKGFGFCDVVLGWDSSDQLYDNVELHRLAHRLSRRRGAAASRDGARDAVRGRHAADPRRVRRPGRGDLPARRCFAGCSTAPPSIGCRVKAAAEFEFFVFEETPHSVRDKGYRDLKPITPGHFGYSMLRSGVHSDFYDELWSTCDEMRIELEGLHTETGPGVIEGAIRVDDALEAADKAALFKTIVKILCQRRGWMATFMAKWSNDWPGQSGHLHMSLVDSRSGKSRFYEEGAELSMSDEMRWFVGGQQALMPELLAMVAPTVNAYTRLIPGFWAPTAALWGYENRTCALRVIGGSDKTQRVEYRIAAADINPYVALAAAIGSGLWGIASKVEPDAPVDGNAYEQEPPPERALPPTLWEAAQRLRGSEAARELFGTEFVDHYAATREWEEREARKAVTDWQLARYFEII